MKRNTKDRMSRGNITSIGLTFTVRERLEQHKIHPSEPYYSVIIRLLDEVERNGRNR